MMMAGTTWTWICTSEDEEDLVDGATYLLSPRWLGGLALGVPGLRLTMGSSAPGPLGHGGETSRCTSAAPWACQKYIKFVCPPSVSRCPEVVSQIRHGMLIVDKTTEAIEILIRSLLVLRAKVLAWRLWG